MNKNSKFQTSNSPLKVAFLGTPEIAATILVDLIDSGLKIDALVTQPDRPCGRGKIMAESPVKAIGIERHIPIYQPSDKDELTAVIKEINPDLCIVAAYGMIIPNEALEIPRYGMINFHPSLLPLYRGPSPIASAILNGDKETGVSIIQIAEKMDAGDILAQQKVKLTGKETTPDLSIELAHLGSSMIVKTISEIESGSAKPIKQNETKATYCKLIKKADGEVYFQKQTATQIDQASRAYTPWPGIYTTWNGKKVDLFDISVLKGTDPAQGPSLEAGEVKRYKDKIAIGSTGGTILVGSLRLEGKNKLTAEEFLRGYRDFIGSKIG